MPIDSLLARGLLTRVAPSRPRAEGAMRRARRSLSTAEKLVEGDHDWAYVIAYDAALQASLALLAARGYRTRPGEGSHKAAVEFAREALTAPAGLDLRLLEKMRRDRHRAVYEAAGSITERQARQACDFARLYLELVESALASPRGGRA